MKNLRPILRRACLAFLLLLALPAFVHAAPPTASANWSADMARFAQADAERPSPPECVLFVGSSSIRLWKSLAQDFPGVPVVNRGFGGSQSVDALVFFDQLVLPHQPRLIVFYAGTNDIAAGRSPEEVAANFAEFCRRVHAERPQARLIFIALQYAPARWALREKMTKANALVADFCARDPRRTFVDLNPFALGPDGQPRLELYGADRLHLSPAGYALWTRELAPLIVAP